MGLRISSSLRQLVALIAAVWLACGLGPLASAAAAGSTAGMTPDPAPVATWRADAYPPTVTIRPRRAPVVPAATPSAPVRLPDLRQRVRTQHPLPARRARRVSTPAKPSTSRQLPTRPIAPFGALAAANLVPDVQVRRPDASVGIALALAALVVLSGAFVGLAARTVPR